MKKLINSFSYSIILLVLSILISLIDTSMKLLNFIPFIVLSFMSPQSYIFFIKEAQILKRTKNDYATFIWLILPYILAPIGFVLFIKKCLEKN